MKKRASGNPFSDGVFYQKMAYICGFLPLIHYKHGGVNPIFHLKLTTYICKNGLAYPYPLFENIGHINGGDGDPPTPE